METCKYINTIDRLSYLFHYKFYNIAIAGELEGTSSESRLGRSNFGDSHSTSSSAAPATIQIQVSDIACYRSVVLIIIVTFHVTLESLSCKELRKARTV